MTDFVAQISEAIRAIVITSPTAYTWFGATSPRLEPRARRALSPATARAFLVASLQRQLYDAFYLRGAAMPSATDQRGPSHSSAPTPFQQSLSAANTGQGTTQDGWEVSALDGSAIAIRRDGLTLWGTAGDIDWPLRRPIATGDRVALRLPKELPNLAPGFYTALSDEPFQPGGDDTVVRVYWHFTPRGAAPFLQAVTSALNAARLPFRLKVLNDPAAYSRADAAVLYLLKDDLAGAAPLLEQVYAAIAGELRPAVPALTKPIAPGVGLAEDPSGGADSFGMQRCRLLAEGIVRAWEQRKRSLSARLAIVGETFAEAGVSFEAPYLNPNAHDDYVLAWQAPAAPRPRRATDEPETFLATAAGLGRQVIADAIWHEGRCTWLGAQPRAPGATGMTGPTWTTLGADLYDGTSGVARFLAELHAVTGDGDTRRTALGALRQALAKVDAIVPPVRLGLYTGLPGVALAAARVGMLLGEDWLLDEARRIARGIAELAGEPHELDLLSGSAGAIVALSRLRESLGMPELLDVALVFGEELLGAAIGDTRGLCWRSPSQPRALPLTGLSHGAAGISLALLELSAATGDARFRDAALEAIAWEQSWFDAASGNWPDFREVAPGALRRTTPLPQASFWCHGAPGIGLARRRAAELLADPALADEAAVALATTRAWITAAIAERDVNFSLCHGLAGNAWIVLGEQGTADASNALAVPARAVGWHGIERYATDGSWPCGTHGGQTPGLMLGLAGIGLFYLHLADPAIPSPLLL